MNPFLVYVGMVFGFIIGYLIAIFTFDEKA